MRERPGLIELTRAKFLFGSVPPIVLGTVTAVSVTGEFSLYGLFLAYFIAVNLQISMQVYNDIYDTYQGSDNEISAKSDYSGGSGILLEYPELISKMFMIGRITLIFVLIGVVALLSMIDRDLWLTLISITVLGIFLVRFYSAPPFQLAYRGLGELAVWLGFGPVLVLIGSLGQSLGLHPTILTVIPITGFSTLFIAWMGELVDRKWDEAAGKRGLVIILGRRGSNFIFLLIHILLLVNVIYAALFVLDPGYPLLITLIPYAVLAPKYWNNVWNCGDHGELKKAAGLNFWLYGSFSIALIVGLILNLIMHLS